MKTLLIISLSALLVGCGENYSNGSRVGVVTKLSKKGLFVDSWEGEMNMGGVRQKQTDSGPVTVPNVFEFNVDESAVSKVKDALNSGKQVEIVYRQWAIHPPTIQHSHVVIDVKEVK